MDYSGWLWVVMDVLAVLALAVAMIYASRRYANRNRSVDRLTDAVTRRNYAEEDRTRPRDTA